MPLYLDTHEFVPGLTAAAVALANLNVLEQEQLVQKTRDDTGPYLQKLLRETFEDHPLIGEIQGTGAVGAIQFSRNKETRERFADEDKLTWHSRSAGFESGAIIRSTYGRLIIAPPLIITHSQIDELIAKMRLAVDKTAEWVKTRS